MDGIKIEVSGNIARVIERPARITSGTIGMPVEFIFDSQWEGLSKMAVFRAGHIQKTVAKIESEAAVPWEVLERPNTWLSIGVYGVNEDGSVAIPTIWANVCVIQHGTDPSGDPTTAPTLSIWNQLENEIKDLDAKIDANAEHEVYIYYNENTDGRFVCTTTHAEMREWLENEEFVRAFLSYDPGNGQGTCSAFTSTIHFAGEDFDIIFDFADLGEVYLETNGACYADFGASGDGATQSGSGNALGDYSVAEGALTTAGCKGYYISAIYPKITDTEGYVFLSPNNEGVIPVWVDSATDATYFKDSFDSGYRVYTESELENNPYGNEFSVSSDSYNHWAFAGIITEIVGNRIKYKATTLNDSNKWLTNVNGGANPFVFFIPAQSDIGKTTIGLGSHAEGSGTRAAANSSHAEGDCSIAAGRYGHAEGDATRAGYAAHAEGQETLAQGLYSHAEGQSTKATANGAHAEGKGSAATGSSSHAEGSGTQAIGNYSHTEGEGTKAEGTRAHAEGNGSHAEGNNSHAEGYQTHTVGSQSHAEGQNTEAIAQSSHAEGNGTIAASQYQHVQGKYNIADVKRDSKGNMLDADGKITTDITAAAPGGVYAHIVGNGTGKSARSNAHTVDWGGNAWFAGKLKIGGTGQNSQNAKEVATKDDVAAVKNLLVGKKASNYGELFNSAKAASGAYSHAEGLNTDASGQISHAEGNATTASGESSHAEGDGTVAFGVASHAEGRLSQAGDYAHAEGYNTTASGQTSHAEGYETNASGKECHAEGCHTEALGDYSHASGIRTIANGRSQFVIGEYNIENGEATKGANNDDTRGNYAFILGNGTEGNRSNAHTVDWAGNAWYAGTVKIGGTSMANAKEVATKADVSAVKNSLVGKKISAGGELFNSAESASGENSHAEGSGTTASGITSHAEGRLSDAVGDYSHAEGYNTTSSGQTSHAEGYETVASGKECHAEGCHTEAKGDYSHASGIRTIANGRSQFVIGEYNEENGEPTKGANNAKTRGNYAFIIGNGTESKPSNAHTIDWNGNAYFAGDVYGGANTPGARLITKDELDKIKQVISPFKLVVSEKDNPVVLKSLQSGLYYLKGYFKVRETSSVLKSNWDYVAHVRVESGVTYIQLFNPQKHSANHYAIFDDHIEETYVYLKNVLQTTGGEMTGDLNVLGSVYLSGVAKSSRTPTEGTDIANKKYVDDAIKAAIAKALEEGLSL